MAATGADQLTSVEEARRLILERASWLGFEPVPLADALGRVLADDIEAGAPVPGFDDSANKGQCPGDAAVT